MLPGMELRQLRYFVAVAEEANISRAAKKIFLTQSALSRQIKALEDEIGQCLLERQAHSIRLTPVGEACCAKLVNCFCTLNRSSSGFALRPWSALEGRLRALVGRRVIVRRGENFTQTHPNARVSCSTSRPRKCWKDWKTTNWMSRSASGSSGEPED